MTGVAFDKQILAVQRTGIDCRSQRTQGRPLLHHYYLWLQLRWQVEARGFHELKRPRQLLKLHVRGQLNCIGEVMRDFTIRKIGTLAEPGISYIAHPRSSLMARVKITCRMLRRWGENALGI